MVSKIWYGVGSKKYQELEYLFVLGGRLACNRPIMKLLRLSAFNS